MLLDVKKIYLSPPDMDGNEKELLASAFDTNWIAPNGPEIISFESDLAKYLNIEAAAALSSGTAALHLALILSSVNQDDFVFCSTFTFAASAFPIMYLKAQPVFIESEIDTWNMSPQFLQEALEKFAAKRKLPKAVIAVDLYGTPAKYSEIERICHNFDVPLICDAAEALGSRYKEKKAGTFGSFGILSFNGNKIITTSGGGALVSNDSKKIEKARFLASQAKEQAPYYLHNEVGYNYRMSNLLAALGRGQLENLDRKVAKRRDNFRYYKERLGTLPGIHFHEEPANCYSNRWITTVILNSEIYCAGSHLNLINHLEEAMIESRPLWKPLHTQPVFKECEYIGDSTSERLFEYGICLPSGSSLTKEDLERICSTIELYLKNRV